jgi:flagellar biosynthesis component FlhA
MRAEVQTLVEAAQIERMLQFHALTGLALATGFVGAAFLAGFARGWPLVATFSNYLPYTAAEGILTVAPGLLLGLAVSQWLRDPRLMASQEDDERDDNQPAMVAVEVGRETLAAVKRAFPAMVAMTRTRLGQTLGAPLPRVALVSQPELGPWGVRLLLRGQPMHQLDLTDREPTETLAGELEGFCRIHAATMLSMDITQQLLAEAAAQSPLVVAQALDRIGLPTLHGVMQGLLREQIAIRDMAGLLEALLVAAPQGGPTAHLIELARLSQSPGICERLADDQGTLYAVELGSAWEEALANPHAWDAGGRSLPPELIRAWRDARTKLPMLGTRLVVLAPRRFRAQVAEWLRHAHPDVAVLAPDEISPRFQLRLIGSLRRPVNAPVI